MTCNSEVFIRLVRSYSMARELKRKSLRIKGTESELKKSLCSPGNMGWSSKSATDAYFDTLKLCKAEDERCDSSARSVEPQTNCELLSALEAGMSAKLIVEVTSDISPSTIALAAAARQSGGHLVCILPEEPPTLDDSKRVICDSGLKDMVEFKVGNPFELVTMYQNIDFSLVDCKSEDNIDLFKVLDVNPRRSVVVANNLGVGRRGVGKYVMKGVKGKVVRTVTHPIGSDMEVTKIGKKYEFETNVRGGGQEEVFTPRKLGAKSKWIVRIDEESGEEHIFRVPMSQRKSL